MTVAEAAKQLECSPQLVYKLCARGRLGYSRIGFGRGLIQISPAQLETYRRSCEVSPVPDEADREWARRRARITGIPDVLAKYENKRKRWARK